VFYPGQAANDGFVHATFYIKVNKKTLATYGFLVNNSSTGVHNLFSGYNDTTLDFTTTYGNSIATINNARSDALVTT
jgi:hypothetical protein